MSDGRARRTTPSPLPHIPVLRVTYASCYRQRPGERSSFSIAQFGIPVLSATFGSEIQQVPQRPEDVDVALVLTLRIRLGEHQFAGPGVAHRVALLHEHVHHGPLVALRVLAVVEPVIAVVGGRE